MQEVLYQDLGKIGYKSAWDYQEKLLKENVRIKLGVRSRESGVGSQESGVWSQESGVGSQESGVWSQESGVWSQESGVGSRESGVWSQESGVGSREKAAIDHEIADCSLSTTNYLLLLEHPPVYTLGKSGHLENILITEDEMEKKGIEFFRTNRGGDITFHGPEQLVGYPILDLEKFYTDIGRYLRNLEEVIIKAMSEYGLKGERSPGETGVWLDPFVKGRERKICAMGVRCSRWITMHGFALNVNTDLAYFDNIIPCGIRQKQVTSFQKELGRTVPMQEIKESVQRNFQQVFEVVLHMET